MTQALQDLLYTRLAAASCASDLAVWGGDPAIFHDQAKSDQDVGWSGLQYPRLVYGVSRQQDPQRGTQGTVTVDLEVRADQALLPWDLAACVKAALDGSAFHPDGEPVQALRWSQTLEFQPAQENDQVKGLTLLFDLSAFPSQASAQVAALNTWTAQQWPTQVQIDPQTWGPSEATPAVYWRLESEQSVDDAPSVTGVAMQGVLVAHVLAPDVPTRGNWVQIIAERLRFALRLPLGETTKLVLRGRPGLNLVADATADPHRRGQIRQTARWWVPAPALVDAPLVETIIGVLPAYEEGFVGVGQPGEQTGVVFQVPNLPLPPLAPLDLVTEEAAFVGLGQPAEDETERVFA